MIKKKSASKEHKSPLNVHIITVSKSRAAFYKNIKRNR